MLASMTVKQFGPGCSSAASRWRKAAMREANFSCRTAHTARARGPSSRAPSDPNMLITTRSRSDEISTYAAASHDDQVLDQMFSSAANELNVPSDQMNEILRLNTICRQFRQWPEGIALIFFLIISCLLVTSPVMAYWV